GDGVALSVGDGDHGIVEGGADVRDARADVLALAAPGFGAGRRLRLFGHGSRGSRDRDRVLGLPAAAPLSRRLLLAGNRPRLALAGARIGMGPLAAHGQAAAVAQAAVTTKIHQAPDVHGHIAAQVALHHVVAIDRLADLQHFGVGQVIDAALIGDADLLADLLRKPRADAVNILQRDDDALLRWNVHPSNTSHACLLKDGTIDIAAAAAATCRGHSRSEQRSEKRTPIGSDAAAPDPTAAVVPKGGVLLAEPFSIVNILCRRQLALDGGCDLGDGAHAIDAAQPALAVVVADQRRGLPVIDHQPPAHRLGAVVGPAQEGGAPARIAHADGPGLAEGIMVAA